MPQKADPSISSIALSEVIAQERIDSEYFQPEFLEVATQLRSADHKRLDDLGTIVTSAFYPAATDLYEHGEIPFIRGVDVIGYPVITNDQPFERIPLSFIRESKGIQELHAGDIVITKVGTPCYAGILHEDLKHCALSRTVLGLGDIDTEGVDPYYLVVFLRCKYGFFQLMREREQQIQLQLTLDRVGRINVFLPEKAVQIEIGNILREYHQQTVLSQGLYRQAEQLLLDELGLSDQDLVDEVSNEANVSAAFRQARLDAEFFQPKYERIEQRIHSLPKHAALGDLGAVTNGDSPKEYVDGGVPVIRAINLRDLDNEDNWLYLSPEDVKFYLKRGDVLISAIGFGSIGKVGVVEEDNKYTTVPEVIVIRSDRLDPFVLQSYLSSPIGQAQLERPITGSTGQLHLFPWQVAQIVVPIPDDDLQRKIAGLHAQAKAAKLRSKELLEQAKRKVEAMIESEVAHG